MSRALIVIHGKTDRNRAIEWIERCSPGTRIEFKATKRSLSQNSMLWARLTDIAQQLLWHGVRLRASDWKILFLDALKREVRTVPNLDGNGFVNLGSSSSDLSREEMSMLLELIAEFAARHGVRFNDPDEAAA